jgi:hypothetical protein
MAIQTEERHALTRLDAGILQRAAQTRRAIRKLLVRKSLIPANHRRSMRILLLRIAQAPQWCKRNIHKVARLA